MFRLWTSRGEWAEICVDLMDNVREEDAPFLEGYLKNLGADIIEVKHITGNELIGLWSARRPRLEANKTKSVARKFVAYEHRNETNRKWLFAAVLTLAVVISSYVALYNGNTVN